MKKFFNYLRNKQLDFQSYVFWFVALLNLFTEKFWPFAFAAIIFTGLQDILDELRKANNNE